MINCSQDSSPRTPRDASPCGSNWRLIPIYGPLLHWRRLMIHYSVTLFRAPTNSIPHSKTALNCHLYVCLTTGKVRFSSHTPFAVAKRESNWYPDCLDCGNNNRLFSRFSVKSNRLTIGYLLWIYDRPEEPPTLSSWKWSLIETHTNHDVFATIRWTKYYLLCVVFYLCTSDSCAGDTPGHMVTILYTPSFRRVNHIIGL